MHPSPTTPLLASLHVLQSLPASARAHESMAAHADVARAYMGEAALASAEAHFEKALAFSTCVAGVDAQVDLRCALADVAARSAEQQERALPGSGRPSRHRARTHAARAAQLAASVACPAWEIKLLLRVSDTFDSLGNHDEATALQTRAVRLMAREADATFAAVAALNAAR